MKNIRIIDSRGIDRALCDTFGSNTAKFIIAIEMCEISSGIECLRTVKKYYKPIEGKEVLLWACSDTFVAIEIGKFGENLYLIIEEE